MTPPIRYKALPGDARLRKQATPRRGVRGTVPSSQRRSIKVADVARPLLTAGVIHQQCQTTKTHQTTEGTA